MLEAIYETLLAIGVQTKRTADSMGIAQPAVQTQTVPAAPAPAAAPFAPLGWLCPVHHQQKVVPAGVSHKFCDDSHQQCKPYDGFVVCPESGCQQKPPRKAAGAPARAIPPSQGGQMP